MFSIIISEKGGAERRETFDRSEITIGRVQGNDLVLPKGNVSKQHARLIFKDGKFAVNDLKSTNGTYVNGRKITQATLVREGDKVYVGDFVLRIEAGSSPMSVAPSSLAAPGAAAMDSRSELPGGQAAGPDGRADARSAPSQGSQPIKQPVFGVVPGPAPSRPSSAVSGRAPAAGPPAAFPSSAAVVGNAPVYGSERGPERRSSSDLSENSGAGVNRPSVPVPTSMQGGAGPTSAAPPRGSGLVPPRASTVPLGQSYVPSVSGRVPASPSGSQALSPAPAPVAPQAGTSLGIGSSEGGVIPANLASAAPGAVHASPAAPGRVVAPSGPGALAARPLAAGFAESRPVGVDTKRLALVASVVQHVEQSLVAERVDALRWRASCPGVPDEPGGETDETLRREAERLARERAAAMHQGGEIASAEDAASIASDACDEVVGIGPMASLLAEGAVSEVHCARHDRVVVVRQGKPRLEPLGWSSEASLCRAIARLARRAGTSWDKNNGGMRVRLGSVELAVLSPPVASVVSASLVKRGRSDTTLEQWVQNGCWSRAMMRFVEACFAARANVVIAGPGGAATELLSALMSARSANNCAYLLCDASEPPFAWEQSSVNRLQPDAFTADAAVRDVVRVAAAHLAVPAPRGATAAAVVESMADGQRGVIAAVEAPTLRHAVGQIASYVARTQPKGSLELARERVRESFDIGVELVRRVDGALRVSRIAEVDGGESVPGPATTNASGRDIFVMRGDGGSAASGESSFAATGVVPRVVAEMTNLGIHLDAALFRRGAS